MNITGAIHMHARLRPRAPAVISPAGSLNFAQLDTLIWRAAVRFREQGLEPGQVVMLDIGDSVRHLIVALALARIGVAHLANFRGQDASVMAPLMARVNAVRTISDAEVRDDGILVSATEPNGETLARMAGEMMQYAAAPWLYVTSSGTTGRPKIIPITHRMTLQRLRRFVTGVPTLVSDRFLPVSELGFHFPKAQAVNALNVGGCVVLADGLDLERALEFIRRVRVTRVSCAPVHLHQLCALAREDMLLPELRVLEVTTSMVPGALRRRVREKVNGNLYVIYGAAETASLTVAPPGIETPGTVGNALPGVHLQIVDAADKPLPSGEVGIIRVRVTGTIDGYHDDAEATAKAFRDGWFYPGDVGMLTEDEQLIFKGRADDMMLFDGINIYPAEIEAVLAAHEAVGEAAAFAVKSDVHQDLPVAAVTLRAPVAEAELLAFCRTRLGPRAPQRIVVVEEFPRNANGKILRRELPGLVQGKPAAAERPGAHAGERGKHKDAGREGPFG